MKKIFLSLLLIYITGISSIFAGSIHQITLGEEDESVIFFNDSEMYFMLPYEKKMMKLDRKLLAYDKDGEITASDARMILRTAVGLEPLFQSDYADESAELPLSDEDLAKLKEEEEAKQKDLEKETEPVLLSFKNSLAKRLWQNRRKNLFR